MNFENRISANSKRANIKIIIIHLETKMNFDISISQYNLITRFVPAANFTYDALMHCRAKNCPGVTNRGPRRAQTMGLLTHFYIPII